MCPPSIHKLEKGYYADGEDAYEMRKPLNRQVVGLPPLEGETDDTTTTTTGAGAGAGAGAGGSSGSSSDASSTAPSTAGATPAGGDVVDAGAHKPVDPPKPPQ